MNPALSASLRRRPGSAPARGLAVALLAAACLAPAAARALGTEPLVDRAPATAGAFPLAAPDVLAPLYVAEDDHPGVIRAVRDLQADLERVTGRRPDLLHTPPGPEQPAVWIGTLGRSPTIDRLAAEGRLRAVDVAGQWESFVIEVIDEPQPGAAPALVIAGSDKRGTIYGIYELCEQIGVSPWSWWADVPVRPAETLSVRPGRVRHGPPSVRYRGIFLNDEAPALTGWVHENFGDYNHEFYVRVFALLLRMKANMLWPAMWNNAFAVDDPLNPRLADEYGIVMGTSHHEPMMRAWKEWERAGHPPGSWDYATHAETLRAYWEESIERTKDYEQIVTLAMRGDGDEPMSEADDIALLEQIVADQRRILAERIDPDVTRIPQVWALYKEVQGYYEKGMRVPDDVTLLWCDDNWGNVRRLPTAAERERPGGAGIYYHFDYVGGPRSYKWLNTTPLPKIWEQMHTAHRHGADRIWIVNVGDLKPMEFPIEFFLHMAWDADRWTHTNLDEYARLWAEREFGPEHAAEIAELISRYPKYNARRKPELLEPDTYSHLHYREADRVLADWHDLAARAQQVRQQLPPESHDAFFQLVQYPIEASAQVAELWIAVGRNRLHAAQGRAGANALAARAHALFEADAALSRVFHEDIADGKWNHMMSQARIGYTSWNQPPRNIMPAVRTLDLPAEPLPAVAVEGSADAWPGADRHPALAPFTPYGAVTRSIDVFNRGSEPFAFIAHADSPWVRIDPASGNVRTKQRLDIGVDWSQLPPGLHSATLRIETDHGDPIPVTIAANQPNIPVPADWSGFVEADGYLAIEAAHTTRNVPADTLRWQEIPDYGNSLSAMTVLPIPADSATPPENTPRLEYDAFFFTTGEVSVILKVAPTLNTFPDRGLRCAVSIDDEPPQILTAIPQDFFVDHGNWKWQRLVWENGQALRSTHPIDQPGPHTIKVWMVDPGIVLERILVDTGGLQPSTLGPPESSSATNDTASRDADTAYSLSPLISSAFNHGLPRFH